MDHIGKAIATIAAAAICAFWAHLTKGKSGIGWFIAALVFIWGC